jgi:hypothetical protein
MLSLEWVHHGYGIGQRQGPRGHRELFIPSCQVNVHFVDYDYALVAGQASQIRSRTYRIEDSPAPPSPGAIATSLDRLTYEPGQIVFRPGDPTGEYYVVLDGEVESTEKAAEQIRRCCHLDRASSSPTKSLCADKKGH